MRHLRLTVASLLLLGMFCCPMAAQEATSSQAASESAEATSAASASSGALASDDLDAIRQTSRDFEQAFNADDASWCG